MCHERSSVKESTGRGAILIERSGKTSSNLHACSAGSSSGRDVEMDLGASSEPAMRHSTRVRRTCRPESNRPGAGGGVQPSRPGGPSGHALWADGARAAWRR
jgi:hypothetical protein